MDNQTAQKLRDAIAKSNTIGIAVGQDPTVDEMAAGLSLYLMLSDAGKKVSIASPSEPIVEVSSLVGINRVQTSLSGGGSGESGDLVVSFPYNEGEIEKVSYTLDEENGFLNIIVKAGEQGLSFTDDDVRFNRGGGGGGPIDLLFVVGTPRLEDLGNVYDQESLRDTRIINIDNKEDNQRFGDIVMVSPKFSSVSEQIADLALSLGMNIDQDAAQNLFSGITFATRNFQDSGTSPLAFEMASFLLKKGANRLRPQQQDRPRDNFQQQQPRQQAQPQPQQQRQQHGGGQPNQQRQQQQQQPRQQQQQNQPRQGQNQGQRDEDRIREEIARAADEQQRQQNQGQQQRGGQQPMDNQNDDQQPEDDQAPNDWLTPKVYKGSSNF